MIRAMPRIWHKRQVRDNLGRGRSVPDRHPLRCATQSRQIDQNDLRMIRVNGSIAARSKIRFIVS